MKTINVVICLKIRTFVVATTTEIAQSIGNKHNTKLLKKNKMMPQNKIPSLLDGIFVFYRQAN